jgi:hypothetical protein
MGSHHPFGHLKHKLWPKEGSGVKLVVQVPTTKSQKLTRFPCVQVVCYILLKRFDKGYNFALDFNSIGGLHIKLWGSKITRIPTLGILGLPFVSLKTKCHLDVGLVERHRVYYKGEGDGFPQVRVMVNLVSLVSPSLPVAHLSTKNAPTMH